MYSWGTNFAIREILRNQALGNQKACIQSLSSLHVLHAQLVEAILETCREGIVWDDEEDLVDSNL